MFDAAPHPIDPYRQLELSEECGICRRPAVDATCSSCGQRACDAHLRARHGQNLCDSCWPSCHMCESPAVEEDCPFCCQPLCERHQVSSDDMCWHCRRDDKFATWTVSTYVAAVVLAVCGLLWLAGTVARCHHALF